MSAQKYYLCVTPFFPSPDNWRGAYVFDQVKALQRHSDYEVIVFKTHSLNDKEEDYTIDGIQVHCIRPLLMPSYVLNGVTEGIIGRMFVKTLKRMGIIPEEIAFIHCHTANHAAFGFGVRDVNNRAKVLLQFHDLDPFTLRNGFWASKRFNRRFRARKSISALSRANLLIAISEPVRDVLISFPRPRNKEVYKPALAVYEQLDGLAKLDVSHDAIYVLNNGVDTRLFNPRDSRKDKCFRIGCIANFQDLKNHMMLLQAFNILINRGHTDLRLSLLGNGETRDAIEDYISGNRLEQYIEWPKEMHHEKLPEYYNTLDLFVLPSRFEGFGCVYTEAYACGVPFICTEHQGAAECVAPEEHGLWLVRDQDYEQLADMIERQYKERNIQHLCKDYDIDILISRFLDYLKTI